ncbi:PP2C family protein-serine/threonine phosphatase [Beggiatoa leptomitoformis]|uniref:SpoIIE family protein phosphatase n=1 Tax=Beggiatoa leptomitoformis TaxID=288004 RepID=A0A2N9YAL5_9GAMM|nr:SpoIIE family protein phosphatase [Beggiatoa leptomitoformis]AUI67513.1 SpoIIE family protein phosphatase [Beggiatoa leptomitoformis]QGX03545.1 SpoIIE family protein phosphatase [Beggiatoa leptomitoformis]
MQNHTTLSKRQAVLVLLGFISILSVLTLAAILGLSSLTTVNQQLETLVTENNVKYKLINYMRDLVRERIISVYNITNMTDPFEIDAEWEKFSEYAREFLKSREQLYHLNLSPHEYQLLENQKAILAQGQATLGKVVDYAQSGQMNTAKQLLAHAQIISNQIISELQEIRHAREVEAEKSLQAATIAYQQTVKQVTTLGGIAILLSLSIIGFVVKRINLQENALRYALREISILNNLLKADNQRMETELSVTRRLQQMVLPKEYELAGIEELDIAVCMEPATEVGGDYYDVLQSNGSIKIGIGDVTGHGLESGVLMLMVQMAVRTLLTNNVTDPKLFLSVLNRAIYDNVQRMDSDKNLTLSLLDYEQGKVRLSGQHEEVLFIDSYGIVKRIDTRDLGFIVGLEPDIENWIAHKDIYLQENEGIVLYTDGVTEALNHKRELYGIKRLCEVISQHWDLSAKLIKRAVIADVHNHLGAMRPMDDITLIVIKQRACVITS